MSGAAVLVGALPSAWSNQRSSRSVPIFSPASSFSELAIRSSRVARINRLSTNAKASVLSPFDWTK